MILFLCRILIQGGLRGQRVLLDLKVSIANDWEGQGFVYIDKMCQKGVSGPL